jgi:uracil phosphoribosyltransferase
MQDGVFVVSHPLVQHKLTLMRQKTLSTAAFRQLVREISPLLLYEPTRDLPLEDIAIETALAPMQAPALSGKSPCFVPILRAGLAFADNMVEILPSASVGHIGLYRHPKTLEAVEYYLKLPDDISERLTIVLDPMLATGNSASAALQRLKEAGVRAMKFVCLLAAPEGIRHLRKDHPDVPIYTAAIDLRLDDHAYIVPGLGDAGDRFFGTR